MTAVSGARAGCRSRAHHGAAILAGVAMLHAAALLTPRPSRAQDFAPPEPAGPSSSAAALLEHALPAGGTWRAELLTTSWLGVPGLVTRAVCATGGLRSVRAAAGWSQTGETGAGWSGAALALGAAAPAGGAAVRVIARRDLEDAAHEDRDGLEVGGGAWLSAGARFVVWASAPQLWTPGAPPPLPRALTAGVAADAEGLRCWFEREAPARSGEESGTHAAGVALRLEAARVWVEGRGRPLRAGFGVTVRAISVRVLSHPRLGDTVTLSLAFPSRAAPP